MLAAIRNAFKKMMDEHLEKEEEAKRQRLEEKKKEAMRRHMQTQVEFGKLKMEMNELLNA
jgi:hypothetical protein